MPDFFGEGNAPRVHDTRWRILQKILGGITGSGGGGALSPQVFSGHGDPVGLQPGQDPARDAIYYNLDLGGTVGWDKANGVWLL